MSRPIALAIAAALAAASALFLLNPILCSAQEAQGKDSAAHAKAGEPKASPQPESKAALPRLVDLGATKCIPCKKMAPILDELKREYAGSLEVVFIDVWENAAEGQKYGISSIPTQIFYDSSGKELFRHQGFYPKEEMLKKWKELGVDLRPSAKP